MMFKIKKRNLSIALVAMSFIFFNCFPTILAKANTNNIIVKPAFMDLGRIDNNPISFTATVTNEDEANTFTANVEGTGKDFISFEPKSFDLAKGESKEVKVQVDNSNKLPVGSYDYSITFSIKSNNKDWVSTNTSNSLRVKFIKEGIDVASIRVTDINKPLPTNFHIIFANLKSTQETINSAVSILFKEDNKEVANFNKNIIMQPYPNDGFYGTMKLNWDTKDVKMGEYIFKYKAIASDGTTLEGEKSFSIGEFKGSLISIEAEDTNKGKPVNISAKISNDGNLSLPATFNYIIKNKDGEEVFKDEKKAIIDVGKVEILTSEWQTDDVAVGEYSVEYKVTMGDEVVSDIKLFKVLNSETLYIIIALVLAGLAITLIAIKRRKKQGVDSSNVFLK